MVTRVKNAVRMRAFPASGVYLPVPPPIKIIRDTKTIGITKQLDNSGREIQKSKLHTLKISLEFHEHKVY